MEQTDKTATTRKRKAIIIGTSALLVTAMAVTGGVLAHRHAGAARLAQARASCAQAGEGLRVAMNEYNTLRSGKAAEAATLTDKQVADKTTLTALQSAFDAQQPKPAACNVQDANALTTAKTQIDKNTAWYRKHTEELAKAVDAANKSYDAKTLKDSKDTLDKQLKTAQAKYKDTDGRVQDDKTRKELRTLIDKASKTKDGADVKAIDDQTKQLRNLMGKVDASVKAKQDADRKAAEEEARREAEAAAAVQAQTVSPQYTAPQAPAAPAVPRQGYTPQYQAPAAPAPAPKPAAPAPAPAAPAAPSGGNGGIIFNHSGAGQGGCGVDGSGCSGTDDGINHNGF